MIRLSVFNRRKNVRPAPAVEAGRSGHRDRSFFKCFDELLAQPRLRTQQPRAEKIEQRPQIPQPIFHRGPVSACGPVGLEFLHGFGLPGSGILDGLGFIEDDHVPTSPLQPRKPRQHAVGCYHQIMPYGCFFTIVIIRRHL